EGDPDGDTTQNLGNSGFASTIQGALDADLVAAMDDEEIDRAVREINEVNRQSGRGANRRYPIFQHDPDLHPQRRAGSQPAATGAHHP
ncbi:hypothetical protein ABTK98_19785, partial [Acinetobacter baumannii]